MYNPYLPQPEPLPPPVWEQAPTSSQQGPDPVSALSALWKRLELDSLDTGDVLTLLLLLFLFWEDREDNLELLLTLGLMLLL